MSETKLVAQTRTEFGKGAARRIRRAHQIPAVMYGHGTEPVHITLPGHETMLALKAANALLSIAPLISQAIREVFEDGSVTSLFDGRAQ